MDRELYQRWHQHPLRYLLRRAAQGGHIYDDEIEDLRLPSKVRAATKQALAKAPKLKPLEVDHLSSELVAALPDHHETREQHEHRRAEQGDAEALANRKAQEQARAEMAERIRTDGGMHT